MRTLVVLATMTLALASAPSAATAAPAPAAVPAGALPALTVTPLISDLQIPWDIVLTSNGTMLTGERAGRLVVRDPAGKVGTVAADFSDLYVAGQTGLMGLALAPDFDTSRRFYSCQGYQTGGTPVDIRIFSWIIDAGWTRATRERTVLTGIPVGVFQAGAHGGCRLLFSSPRALLVGTGDVRYGPNPQDLTSLGGKVLRINPITGGPAFGNPFASSANPNTRRIYTYGHRNVQGLVIRPGTADVFAVEQGTDRDDEVNILRAGGNYGFDPDNPDLAPQRYDETHPMTDTVRFPDAVPAVWSSGFPTIATAGGTFVRGRAWGDWNGALAITALAGTQLRLLRFDRSGTLLAEAVPPELNGTFGRLRSVTPTPDGALLITTSNGTADQVLRVAPTAPTS